MSRYKPVSDVRTDPLTALRLAVNLTHDHGDPVPCEGDDRWISDDPDVMAEVVPLCWDCPVLGECSNAAAYLRPHAGVWAGIPRSPKVYVALDDEQEAS